MYGNSRKHGSAVVRGGGSVVRARAQTQRAQRAKLGSGFPPGVMQALHGDQAGGPTLPWSSEGLGQSEVPATASG